MLQQTHYTAKCGISQYWILRYCIIFLVIKMKLDRIRALREDKDMTQKQISKILNCSQQVYSDYELGKREIPLQTLIALAKFHNVTTDYILGLSDK